ncbi:Longin-like domain [Pseudocohnilembus persalinus]|uniref:Trafficking protein particle complex subunit n=1 Tax=Pseudocohnilembus persalinus TaxID=266149 RepID=A0A0V0QTF0_PSEPJ|nr:Longin-like domain [Pseudocohnilembus persalinus]|eukprot:KRX05586.1 Longin-like domain [Pseudocohnilembus persalinus]
MNYDKQNLFFMLINPYGQLIFNKKALINNNKNEKKNILDNSNDNRMQSIVSEGFRISCFHTITNLRFVLVTEPNKSQDESIFLLQEIYRVYSDYVSKDPFYVQGQPIKSAQFNKEVIQLLQEK